MAKAARRRAWALPSAASLFLLALPLAAQDGPQVFGDWELSCAEGACSLTQSNAEAETGNIRMRTAFTLPARDRLLLSVTVPGSVLLSEGPWLTTDGLFVSGLSYVSCETGCLSQVWLSPAEIGILASGARGVVTVTTGNGQRVGIPLSLDGLGQGLAALVKTQPDAPVAE